jgi:tripartite-type tricarboxylate transporter receptor subunit TctC
MGGWHMMTVPKQTPTEVVSKLNAELNATLSKKEMKESLVKLGLEPANATLAEAASMLQSEWQRWGGIVKAAAVTAE